jgi:hypothetical protein
MLLGGKAFPQAANRGLLYETILRYIVYEFVERDARPEL